MRKISEIIINGTPLSEILEEHKNGTRADLSGADLREAYLSEAYLSGADLRGAYLYGADLSGADLREAYLSGADLRGADLRGANLRGADLRGADLRGANLRGADLRGAYLSEAYLYGADLSEADLRGAYLSGAKGILSIGPIGSRASIMYAVKHTDCIMVRAGCFWGTAGEFLKAVAVTHENNKHARDYKLAVKLVKSYFEKES